MSRSSRLRSRPPAYPVSLPSLPTTRWHGTTIESGLRPTAPPTARAIAGSPSSRASSPYVVVSPYGMRAISSQTRSWNASPAVDVGQLERRPPAGEVLAELLLDVLESGLGADAERRRVGKVPVVRVVHAGQRAVVGDERQLAERRVDDGVRSCHRSSCFVVHRLNATSGRLVAAVARGFRRTRSGRQCRGT